MTYTPFSVIGFETEYMLADATTWQARPLATKVLGTAENPRAGDLTDGKATWSNEFFSHVIELKTSRPENDLWAVEADLQQSIGQLNQRLGEHGACLLPSGAHPFFDPSKEGEIWSGEGAEVYQRYGEIFDLDQPGWKNVQSVHVNLPFDSEESFVRLHAAVRVLLPLLAAMAASSPFALGKRSPWLDGRLHAYRDHQRAIPQTMGKVIPEPIQSQAEYEKTVLEPIAAAVAPWNADGLLSPLFMNARGAIARFDRSAIEVRVADAQECLQADLAISHLVSHLAHALYQEKWSSFKTQQAFPTDALAEQLWLAAEHGETAPILSAEYTRLFGLSHAPKTARGFWEQVFEEMAPSLAPRAQNWCEHYLAHGPLARRLVQHERPLADTCKRLADCLAQNTLYAA